MATMIAVRAHRRRASTPSELDEPFRAAVDRTFNCVSIDTDTSTSDTAVVLASGAAGPVDRADVRRRARRGVPRPDEADRPRRRGRRDADRGPRRPGARPRPRPSAWPRRSSTRRWSRPPCTAPTPTGAAWRWRSASAATTPTSTTTRVVIRFGDRRCTRRASTTPDLARCPTTSRGDEVLIHVSLGTGDAVRHRVGLRPHRRLRPDQRRLHDLRFRPHSFASLTPFRSRS